MGVAVGMDPHGVGVDTCAVDLDPRGVDSNSHGEDYGMDSDSCDETLRWRGPESGAGVGLRQGTNVGTGFRQVASVGLKRGCYRRPGRGLGAAD